MEDGLLGQGLAGGGYATGPLSAGDKTADGMTLDDIYTLYARCPVVMDVKTTDPAAWARIKEHNDLCAELEHEYPGGSKTVPEDKIPAIKERGVAGSKFLEDFVQGLQQNYPRLAGYAHLYFDSRVGLVYDITILPNLEAVRRRRVVLEVASDTGMPVELAEVLVRLGS